MVFVGVALSGSHLNVRYIAAAAGTEIVHSITINTRVPLTHGATKTECQASTLDDEVLHHSVSVRFSSNRVVCDPKETRFARQRLRQTEQQAAGQQDGPSLCSSSSMVEHPTPSRPTPSLLDFRLRLACRVPHMRNCVSNGAVPVACCLAAIRTSCRRPIASLSVALWAGIPRMSHPSSSATTGPERAQSVNQPGLCAICQHAPLHEPLVMHCGHLFCGPCIRSLLDQSSLRPIDCPVCRSSIFDVSELFL